MFKLSSDASLLRAYIELSITTPGTISAKDIQIATDLELLDALLNRPTFAKKRILVRVRARQRERRSSSPEDNGIPDRRWLQGTNVYVTEKVALGY